MIKKTVQYVDFNDEKQTDDLYFNLTKTELTDHMTELHTEINAVEALLKGDKRTLTIPEVQKILALVKRFAELSYGVRSEDGKRFRKNDEIWADFKDSAAYDAFISSMFEKPEEMFDFLNNVMPQDLIEQAKKQAGQDALPFADGNAQSVGADQITAGPAITGAAEPEDPFKHMTREEMEAALRAMKS